ncbi:hypothetical protein LWI29_019504 [Acer saccharum]|uniref:Small ribosomal subunit protein uS17 N-terminal domain-containing protein n=1 Tax=Acer saccharum TaxID=4024 RepID=A0AA39T8B9_ACESA|nr:hypothetical protein LWI29_019504 [Acer saccharum]
MVEQTEKAFLKQPKVFLSSNKTGKGKRPGKGGNRFWKSIGLGSRHLEMQLKVLTSTRSAHSPALFLSGVVSLLVLVTEGDHVIIGQCRPLSKTVRFNVLKVIPAGSSGGAKKAFIAM